MLIRLNGPQKGLRHTHHFLPLNGWKTPAAQAAKARILALSCLLLGYTSRIVSPRVRVLVASLKQ